MPLPTVLGALVFSRESVFVSSSSTQECLDHGITFRQEMQGNLDWATDRRDLEDVLEYCQPRYSMTTGSLVRGACIEDDRWTL